MILNASPALSRVQQSFTGSQFCPDVSCFDSPFAALYTFMFQICGLRFPHKVGFFLYLSCVRKKKGKEESGSNDIWHRSHVRVSPQHMQRSLPSFSVIPQHQLFQALTHHRDYKIMFAFIGCPYLEPRRPGFSF